MMKYQVIILLKKLIQIILLLKLSVKNVKMVIIIQMVDVKNLV